MLLILDVAHIYPFVGKLGKVNFLTQLSWTLGTGLLRNILYFLHIFTKVSYSMDTKDETFVLLDF